MNYKALSYKNSKNNHWERAAHRSAGRSGSGSSGQACVLPWRFRCSGGYPGTCWPFLLRDGYRSWWELQRPPCKHLQWFLPKYNKINTFNNCWLHKRAIFFCLSSWVSFKKIKYWANKGTSDKYRIFQHKYWFIHDKFSKKAIISIIKKNYYELHCFILFSLRWFY